LVLGLEVFRNSKGTLFWLEWQLFVGLYGSVGMIWFLINHVIYISCRWSLGECSGSEVGLSSPMKKGEEFWNLVALSWRPSPWRSFMGLGGTLLSVLRASCRLLESQCCHRCVSGCFVWLFTVVWFGWYCGHCWVFGCCVFRAGLWPLVSGSVYSCSSHAAVMYLGCRRFTIVEAGTRFLNLKRNAGGKGCSQWLVELR
jgi:hypothetical protein